MLVASGEQRPGGARHLPAQRAAHPPASAENSPAYAISVWTQSYAELILFFCSLSLSNNSLDRFAGDVIVFKGRNIFKTTVHLFLVLIFKLANIFHLILVNLSVE